MTENGDPGSTKTQRVSLTGVQLKLVGESLEIIQDDAQKWKLDCVCEGKSCKVSISNGKPHISPT